MKFSFAKTFKSGLLSAALILSSSLIAQTDSTEMDLLSLLGEDEEINYTSATFKSTRNINGHTVENVAGGVLDFRISHRFGFYVLPNQLSDEYTNSLSVGVDIETGGHVFQLHFTNSTSMTEPGFITENVGMWKQGDIHFGFNVSRVFTIVRKKEAKDW
jgi:hypothetical protein